ncbi:MAG TPA: LacI family DNA-binding transcriptional regulator, partial [Phycisphaeraceae bacterium]
MTKTVTAHDVARAAGVSQITVSRTFSGKAPVAEATRQRILHVAERMGYRPNILAAGLRGGQTTSVGALWSFGMAGDDARIGLEILRSAQKRGYATYQAEHP